MSDEEKKKARIAGQKALASKMRILRKSKVTYSTIIGNKKRVKLPDTIIDELAIRLTVDSSSNTGLRWSDSNMIRADFRGKEAGSVKHKASKYFYIYVVIDKIKYAIQAANAVWMLVRKTKIEGNLVINHINLNSLDNSIENLELVTNEVNAIRRGIRGSSEYKNVSKDNLARRSRKPFRAYFKYRGKSYSAAHSSSQHHALILGWELITSGKVPLDYVKGQSTEWKDGTYLQRALAECEKQGIAVTPPKFKTLYEYIASVESEAA